MKEEKWWKREDRREKEKERKTGKRRERERAVGFQSGKGKFDRVRSK